MRSRPTPWLIAFAVAAFVAASAVGCGGDRANAALSAPIHNPDPYAYWYCSVHRSSPQASVVHSEAYALYPNRLQYWCIQDSYFFGVRHQFFVEVSPPFSGNSYRVSGYQNCNLITCQVH